MTNSDQASMVGVAESVAKSTSMPWRRQRPASDIIRIESRPCPIRLSAGLNSVDIDAEQFGYLRTDVLRARGGTHHEVPPLG